MDLTDDELFDEASSLAEWIHDYDFRPEDDETWVRLIESRAELRALEAEMALRDLGGL